MSLSGSPRKSAKTVDDSILVIGRAGKRGGPWAPPSPGTTVRLAFCLHKSRPQGLGRGNSLGPFPFLPPSPTFSPSLYFSSSTHKGEEKPKNLTEVGLLDMALSSFSFHHSLFCLSPSLLAAAIVSNNARIPAPGLSGLPLQEPLQDRFRSAPHSPRASWAPGCHTVHSVSLVT